MYPLRFDPIFRRYLWGGRRLGTMLGKPIGPEEDYAECWEVVDHDRDQSVVRYGPWRGRSLGELVRQDARAMLGAALAERVGDRSLPESLQRRFPLLFKFLDAQQNLSVQVHPPDAMARRLDPPDWGKTEAWYVWHAEPGSRVYGGFLPGVDRQAFLEAAGQGATDQLLHSWEPRVGDCILVPAGTIHAIGRGLLVAEVQQSSDTTFRLFDWNRMGGDGRPRPLHIDQGLAALDFSAGPLQAFPPSTLYDPRARRVVECDRFAVDAWQLDGPQEFGGDDRFYILVVVQGAVQVAGDPGPGPVRAAESVLLPAALPPTAVSPISTARVLVIHVPAVS